MKQDIITAIKTEPTTYYCRNCNKEFVSSEISRITRPEEKIVWEDDGEEDIFPEHTWDEVRCPHCRWLNDPEIAIHKEPIKPDYKLMEEYNKKHLPEVNTEEISSKMVSNMCG